MKKTFLIVIYFSFLVHIFSEQVDLSNEGISKAIPGDYVIRYTGEMVILNQADIDYAKNQLGLNKNDVQNIRQSQGINYNTNIERKFISNGSPFIGIALTVIIIFVIKYYRKNKGKTFYSYFRSKNINENKTYIDQNGYRRFTDTNKAVHRWIAEKKLGRKLFPGEVVHHKNRNKLDNSMENLEIFPNQSIHDKEHEESGWY